YEIPEEIRPYVKKAIEAITAAVSLYPITPLFQFQPRPVVQPSQYQNLLAAQMMTMPFGGISPFLTDISILFPQIPSLPQIWEQRSEIPLGIENLLAQLEAMRQELERLRSRLEGEQTYYPYATG
ncbi:MAG: hypothetical protein QXO44_00800, partial [Thermoplasmatales archaeon]